MDPFVYHEGLLNKYLHAETIPFVKNSWNEPHRKYHNVNHLVKILEYIERQRFRLNQPNYDALVLAAFFHDVYYQTRGFKNNEDESIKRFVASYKHHDLSLRNAVIEMINATKFRKRPDKYLVRMFWDADNSGFYGGYENLLKYENLIRDEYKHVPYFFYRKKRIEFLRSNIGLFDNQVDKDIEKLIDHISNR